MINRNLKNMLLWVCIFLYSGGTSADYFAYIPDIANQTGSKYLHVVNTDFNVLVESIVLFGAPREVVVSHKGDYVFVSTELIETGVSESKINVISTSENSLIIPISLANNSNTAWGMTLSKNDSLLYVTDRSGIIRITKPTSAIIQDSLDLTYSGNTVALSDDDNFLFVLGPNSSGSDFGISVVDVSNIQMKVITDFSLGADVGAFDIVFNSEENLYVLNRRTAQLVRVGIVNYNSPADLLLYEDSVIALPDSSYPTDIALNNDRSELFITLSYVNEGNVGTGNGYILAFKTLDLSIIDTISLSNEGSVFALAGGALHPRGLSFDDSGKLHVIKQLWSEFAGTYVSSIDDTTNRRSGLRKFSEGAAITLGKRSANLTNGKFIGPDCSYCPTGVVEVKNSRISASALNPIMILFTVFFFLVFRALFSRHETHHTRSRWRHLPRFR